ncbi:gamma carbonic anhydrase 1 [Populus alba x Populus x berolinensis]|nr:gamma carbonic anhydrase 1 [Populus alba x Populus x berolinensis]
MGTLGRAIYTVGFWVRETGQALDRLGCRLQGNYYFQEQLSRHRTLMNIFDKAPVVDKDAFVAPGASVIGDVLVGRGSSIWYGCVLRGDVNSISVGSGTNIQDNSLVHVAKSNLSGKVLPTIIGDNVTVGHSAVLHGCTVEDEAFVGMGATLLDGVVVEKHAMVAAGALVRQNTRIPTGEFDVKQVWGGNPAKFLRKLTDEEIAFISQSATNYSNLAQVHAAENAKPFDEIEFEKVLRKKFAKKMRSMTLCWVLYVNSPLNLFFQTMSYQIKNLRQNEHFLELLFCRIQILGLVFQGLFVVIANT